MIYCLSCCRSGLQPSFTACGKQANKQIVLLQKWHFISIYWYYLFWYFPKKKIHSFRIQENKLPPLSFELIPMIMETIWLIIIWNRDSLYMGKAQSCDGTVFYSTACFLYTAMMDLKESRSSLFPDEGVIWIAQKPLSHLALDKPTHSN